MNTPSHTPVRRQDAWHPTDYLRILYKRRWIAIPGFLLLFLSGALESIRSVPVYEAGTQILVEQDAQRRTSLEDLMRERDSYDDPFYETQYRLMRSRTLALRTALALESSGAVERVPESTGPDLSLGALIGWARGTVAGLIGRGRGAQVAGDAVADAAAAETAAQADKIDGVLGGLAISPVRDSRLVYVRFQSPDPNYAARVANEHARQYQQQSLEARFMASQEANDWLREQLEEQRRKVLESEAALQRYREVNNASSMDGRQNIVVQRLTELNAQVTRARIDRLDKEAYYNRIIEIQRNGESLETVPAVMASDVVQSLKTEINGLRAERAQLQGQGFGDGWPAVRDLTARISAAEERLQVEMNRVVDSIRNDYLSAQALERSLTAALDAQRGESTALDRKAIEYAALEREAQSNRELYEDLLQRTQESGLSREYRAGNVQIVDAAEVPRRPVSPNVPQDLLMAAMRGMFFAVLLVIGLEYFDSRLKTPEEVKQHLGLPFLGMVPRAGGKVADGEPMMLSAETPASFSEAIRAVRTAVLFASADEGARTVVVTSTGPSEGKTVVSSSLAVALAQAGQRTLIVDADMRRPRMHEVLGRSQEPGLSNVLVGEAKLEDATRVTSVANLSLLAAGHIPPNPAELVGSKKYLAMMEELKGRFDWIIIDAPPVMPVTDAAVLANTAGGVVFVVGSEMTQRQAAMAAVEQLRSANAKFIGAVLNRVNVQRHQYYYSPYYRKEYGKYYQRSANRA